MKLVIFDIDGTLTRTNEADEACFASSVREFFKIQNVSTNWSDYEHSTDSGIIDELVRRHLGRAPMPEELASFRDVFVRHLENHYSSVPQSFQEVAGAASIFVELGARAKGWTPAIATGGWKRSAQLKLSKAGIPFDQIPAAFADDAFSRDEIIQKAMSRVHQKSQIEKVVYVGDGHWDFLTCQRLRIPFVGVTDTRDPKKLKSAGVKTLIQDYAQFDRFLNALESAEV